MRHRLIINLDDTQASHEALLIFLESIKGRNKKSQALTEILMAGFHATDAAEAVPPLQFTKNISRGD